MLDIFLKDFRQHTLSATTISCKMIVFVHNGPMWTFRHLVVCKDTILPRNNSLGFLSTTCAHKMDDIQNEVVFSSGDEDTEIELTNEHD